MLAQSPITSSSYWWANDSFNYSPRFASYILVEKAEKKRKILLVFQKLFRKAAIPSW